MKVPVPIVCSACGEKFNLEVIGSDLPEYSQCPKCRASAYNMWPLGNVVTLLLMERARQELAKDDVSLAILLSAVAVEGEMAYLFFKWKGLDSGKFIGDQTPEDKRAWEDEWANMRSIGKRLDELSRFLTGKPFNEFARLRKDLLKTALASYDPATSIKDFIQESFFELRNDIAHYGKIDFKEPDGTRCLSLGSALLALFHTMDIERADAMEDTFKKAR